ncbi:unnamed protein product [Amoebophrya sp. A25]|nr:unnamed protein product [Amoebophrya sp. A25]|eukprot:GSA25T00023849001.1
MTSFGATTTSSMPGSSTSATSSSTTRRRAASSSTTRMALRTFAALGCLASAVMGKETEIPTATVEGRITIPQPFRLVKDLYSQIKMVLSNNVDTRVVFPDSKGKFSIPDVMAGDTYSLELHHPVLWFDSIVVDVGRSPDAHNTDTHNPADAKVTPYLTDLLYGRGKRLRYPLELAPSTVKMYFNEREDFNLLSLFRSPMVLMMGVMFVFIYLMPKLMPTPEDEEPPKRAVGNARPRGDVELTNAKGGKRVPANAD